jgi:hypothetical protein
MKYQEAINFLQTEYAKKALARSVNGRTAKDLRNPLYSNRILERNRIKREVKDFPHIADQVNSYKLELRDVVIITELIMEILLNSIDYRMETEKLIEEVIRLEKRIKNDSKNYRISKNSDAHKFMELLKIAWEDKKISSDEFILLRKAFGIFKLTKKEKWLMEASEKVFPKNGGNNHEKSEVDKIITYLKDKAILFPIKEGKREKELIIPKEIGEVLREEYEVDLQSGNIERLLKEPSLYKKRILKFLCDEFKIDGKNRPMEESVKLISSHGVSGKKILILISGRYEKNFRHLSDKKKAYQKRTTQKINFIINKFNVRLKPDHTDKDDKREKLLEYYEELATRKYLKLLEAKIVNNPEQMWGKFEEASRYIFEKYFQVKPENQTGSNKPDFVLKYGKNHCIIGDCKASRKREQHKSKNHLQFKRQFTDYIRQYKDSNKLELRAFLVIVPETNKSSEELADLLKTETDIDVAVVSAKELQELGELWGQKNKPLNLEVFNYKGILTYQKMLERLEVLERLQSKIE